MQNIPVSFHDMFKRPEKVFLESEVGKLSLLYKLHGELPQWIHRKEGYVLKWAASNLVKEEEINLMLTDDFCNLTNLSKFHGVPLVFLAPTLNPHQLKKCLTLFPVIEE